MDDEFALCWNNFQENIATGFQNLYDRGDLVDVTLACDGKLLHAHKIVLAICSPYFQEMFHTNPCKHPIIVLKDVAFGVMCELLQFMYQGVVNVKHTELQSFMKIAQMLQVKGLATSPISNQKSPSLNQSNANSSTAANLTVPGSSASSSNNPSKNNTSNTNNNNNTNTNPNNSQNDISNNNANDPKVTAPPASSSASSSSSISFSHIKSPNEGNNHTSSALMTGPGLKRLSEYSTDTLSIYSRKVRRNTDNSDHDINSDSMDHMSEDVFLPPIPHISMMEPRFDLNNVKRESSDHLTSPSSLRNSLPPPFGFDYNLYAANKNIEYPNDLHMPSDYSKSFANHMDIPPIAPGERWFHGKLEFMLSQRGKPLLVHDGHTFGIQYVRKDKKYWQCNLSRKFNCKARVTTTDTGEIIVTNNEHCHTEIRQHLRKDYQRNKVMMNALMNLSTSHHIEQQLRRNSNNCFNNSNVKDDLSSHCHNSNNNCDDNENDKSSTSNSSNNNNNNWKNNRNSTI